MTEPAGSFIEQDGAKVVVDPFSLGLLSGASLDYNQEMIRSSFVVAQNPNTEGSCGCGVSFNIKNK